MVTDEESVTDLDIRARVLPDVGVQVTATDEVDIARMPPTAVGEHHPHLLDTGGIGPNEGREEADITIVDVLQM